MIASYGYDAAGRRITRTVNGSPNVSREYLYFPDGRLMAEADGTGAIIREYLWLEELPLAAVDVSGSPTLYYIHAGHRGEPLAMTDASRTKVWDASYEPFGAATIFTATTPLDLRLPGQQLQAETALHQNWMRDYDPALGRYAQPDPIGLAGGPNVYSYVGQDPLNYTDPYGLWVVQVGGQAGWAFGVGGLVGAGVYFGTTPDGHFEWGGVSIECWRLRRRVGADGWNISGAVRAYLRCVRSRLRGGSQRVSWDSSVDPAQHSKFQHWIFSGTFH